MARVDEVFAQVRPLLGSVPGVEERFVCRFCLGPMNPGFVRCLGCERLFGGERGAPRELGARVVPMTSALNPSPWYTRLATYKVGNPEYRALMGALAYTWLAAHERRIAELLGGEATLVTIVPSKRGIGYEEQPLRKALAVVPPLGERLVSTLTFRAGGRAGRHRYHSESFGPGPVAVVGERVVLIEDTWVTGATAMSAAGALMEHGAEAVAVVPLARCVDSGFWAEGHGYREAMGREYRVGFWPR